MLGPRQVFLVVDEAIAEILGFVLDHLDKITPQMLHVHVELLAEDQGLGDIVLDVLHAARPDG